MGGYDDSAIGAFDFHHSMLADRVRTEAFLRAILTTVGPGDVVVDIGAGTGVLSLFAVMAGAQRVYAIEQEPIIEVAREIADSNGVADRITFVQALSSDIELPEQADVVISETVGNVGLDEGICAWMADARRRFAAPDARFVPCRIAVEAAPVEIPRDISMVERWSEPLHSLDFSALRRLAANNVMWVDLNPVALVSDPLTVAAVDAWHAGDINRAVSFTARRRGTIHGLGAWFTAWLTDGISISNAPPNAVPSWEQGLLPLLEPVAVAPGDVVDVEITVSNDGSAWSWSVGQQTSATRYGTLGHTTTD